MDTESEPERGMDELPGGNREDSVDSKGSNPVSGLDSITFEDSRGGDWEAVLDEERDGDKDTEDVKRSIGLKSKYHPYCFGCKKKVPVREPTFIILANSRLTVQGFCGHCGHKVSRLIKKPKDQNVVLNEYIEVYSEKSIMEISSEMSRLEITETEEFRVDEKRHIGVKTKYHPYCFKCEKKVPVEDPKFMILVNGRLTVQGLCAHCHGKVSRIIKRPENKNVVLNDFIKVYSERSTLDESGETTRSEITEEERSLMEGSQIIKGTIAIKTKYYPYCFRCKEKVPVENASFIILVNDRLTVQGLCGRCLGRVSRLIKRPENKIVVINEYIDVCCGRDLLDGARITSEMEISDAETTRTEIIKDIESSIGIKTKYRPYCFRCEKKVSVKEPNFMILVNGRLTVQGLCAECLGKVSRLIKKPRDGNVVMNDYIDVHYESTEIEDSSLDYVEETKRYIGIKTKYHPYCFGCKEKVPVKNPKFIILSNGRLTVQGLCGHCDHKVSRLIKRPDDRHVVLNDYLEIHLEKTIIKDSKMDLAAEERGCGQLMEGKDFEYKKYLEIKTKYHPYCFRCKEKVPVKEPTLMILENGRLTVQGLCALCLGKVSRLIKRPKDRDVIINDYIDVYCERIMFKESVTEETETIEEQVEITEQTIEESVESSRMTTVEMTEHTIIEESEGTIQAAVVGDSEEAVPEDVTEEGTEDISKDVTEGEREDVPKDVTEGEREDVPKDVAEEERETVIVLPESSITEECEEEGYIIVPEDSRGGAWEEVTYEPETAPERIEVSEEPVDDAEKEYLAYCFNCQKNTDVVNPMLTSLDGGEMIVRGSCSYCFGMVSRLLRSYTKPEEPGLDESGSIIEEIPQEPDAEEEESDLKATIEEVLEDLKDEGGETDEETADMKRWEFFTSEETRRRVGLIPDIIPYNMKSRILRDLDKYGRLNLIIPFTGFEYLLADVEGVSFMKDIPEAAMQEEETMEEDLSDLLEAEVESEIPELLPVMEEEGKIINVDEILDGMMKSVESKKGVEIRRETEFSITEFLKMHRTTVLEEGHELAVGHKEMRILQCRSCRKYFCGACAAQIKNLKGYGKISEEMFQEYFEPLCIDCWDKFQERFNQGKDEVNLELSLETVSPPPEPEPVEEEKDESTIDLGWRRRQERIRRERKRERYRHIETEKRLEMEKRMKEKVEFLETIKKKSFTITRREERKEEVLEEIPDDEGTEKKIINSIGMRLNLIQEGSFMMGSERSGETRPVHRVTIKKPFYISVFPVTQKEWLSVMGTNPSNPKGEYLPVVNVSWNDCFKFIMKLNVKEGSLRYRLPSEAEWEYAARAGNPGRFCFGDDEKLLPLYGWFGEDWDVGTLHQVGLKKPNEWGIYDIHGNVWEWCEDKWHDNYIGAPKDGRPWMTGRSSNRVRRGGTWANIAVESETAVRNRNGTGYRYRYLGFRVVKSI